MFDAVREVVKKGDDATWLEIKLVRRIQELEYIIAQQQKMTVVFNQQVKPEVNSNMNSKTSGL